jgi:HSP20 family protein
MWGMTRFNPWTELAGLHRDLDAVFNRQFGTGDQASVDVFTPAAERARDGDKWTISMYVPGVTPNDVDINVNGQTLHVRGERKRHNHVEPLLSEIMYGRFEREFTLPAEIDVDHVDARYHDGVLELALPVKESAKPRKIEIATSPDNMKHIKAA